MARSLASLYEFVLRALMALAAVYIGLMMVAIVYFTSFRTLGIPYSGYAFVFIEYGFIYCIMLGAPWFVRQKAHIYIEIVTAAVPEGVRNVMSRCIAAVCVVVFALLAWYSGVLAFEDWSFGELDVRGSRDIPRWIVTGSMPLGFALMAIEFARFVYGPDTLHSGETGVHE